jgi:hypothetical protein
MANAANISAQLQGTRLFGRQLNLTIGFPLNPALDVKVHFNDKNSAGLDTGGALGIDVDFIVEKSLKPTDPNTCEIKIYNLAPASRQAISGQHAVTVRLEAGYQGGVTQLYFAEARAGWTALQTIDYITHIESTDTIARPSGVRRTKKPIAGSATGNIVRSYGAKVPIRTAFEAVSQAMGIGVGNLEAGLAQLGRPLPAVYGGALMGNAAKRMTDLCRSAGLEWSIQDGNLQILDIGGYLSTEKAIELAVSPGRNTGLVGSPSVDSQGAVSATALIIPGLVPGVLVDFDTLFVSGGYRVEKVRYQGSTRERDWYAHFDCVKY